MKDVPRLMGVIHLQPLPGSPGAIHLDPSDALQRAAEAAFKEAQLLSRAGFQALILENFGDVPFYGEQVPPETIAAMSVIATAVREVTRVPLGINVLRNDARAALAIASVAGCEFIRVNVLSGVAAELVRERARLGSSVRIFADAQVKHARTLSSESIEQSVEDLVHRAYADAVIVSGSGTGKAIERSKLQDAGRVARKNRIPLYVGSGVTAESLESVMEHAEGVIVSSALRKKGQAGAPLDPARVKQFMTAWKRCR